MEIIKRALGISANSFIEGVQEKFSLEIKNGIARDVVTNLDMKIDMALKEYFQALKISYFSEENKFSVLDCGDSLYAISDPLDGSLNFTCDLNYYATTIALIENGKLTEGGIISHARGITITSDGIDTQFSRRYKLDIVNEKVVPPIYLAYGPKVDAKNKFLMENLMSAPPEIFPGIFRFGSAAHAALDYISGRYSSCVFLNVRIWDIAGALPAIYALANSKTYIKYSKNFVSLISFRTYIKFEKFFTDFIDIDKKYKPLVLDTFDFEYRSSILETVDE